MSEVELRHELSYAHMLMFGIGGLIGAGIYALSGFLIVEAGSYAVLIFVIDGLLSLPSGLVYAEFSSKIPSAGGWCSYIRQSFPGVFPFLRGWTFFLAYVFASAFYVLTSARHLYVLAGWNMLLSSLVVIGVFFFLNAVSAGTSGNAELLLICIKVGILVLFSAIILLLNFPLIEEAGSIHGRIRPSFFGFLALPTVVFIAFEGYDIIATTGAEARKPRRDIPGAIIAMILLGIVLYVLVAVSMLVVVAPASTIESTENYEEVILRVAKEAMGGVGEGPIILGVILSILSAYNESFLTGARVLYAMSRDGYISCKISHLSARFRTPIVSLLLASLSILFAVISICYGISRGIIDVRESSVVLGSLASTAFASAFAFVGMSLIAYRKKHGLGEGFRVPPSHNTHNWRHVCGIYSHCDRQKQHICRDDISAGDDFWWHC